MANGGAIVLAGGRSERMGQDKALLRRNGLTLLETVVNALRPLVGEIVIVADHDPCLCENLVPLDLPDGGIGVVPSRECLRQIHGDSLMAGALCRHATQRELARCAPAGQFRLNGP